MNQTLFNQFFRAGGGFIINRIMLRLYGAELSVFMADLADRDEYFAKKFPQHEGWFYAIKERRSLELGMSERTLARLMKVAKEKNLVKTVQKGIPAKEWILIDYEEIQRQLETCLLEEKEAREAETREASLPRTAEASLPRTAEASGPRTAEALYIINPKEMNPNINENENKILSSPDGESAPALEKGATPAPKPSKRNIPITTESKTPPTITPEEVLTYWNGIMKDTPIPKVLKLSSVRKKHLQARIKEIPCRKEWRDIFKRIASSKFLRGESGGGDWKANFDWIISNDTNYAKVLEGRYDSTPKTHNMERNMKIDHSKYNGLAINRRSNDDTNDE